MAILTRVTGKVFGSQAPADEIGVFGSAKAGNPTTESNVALIQGLAAYLQGWGSGIVSSQNFPPMEEVTGVLKTISYQACYSLQAGVPTYDANTEYGVGDIYKEVNDQQVTFYVAIRDANTGDNTPNIGKQGDTTFWQKVSFYDDDIGVPRFSLKLTGDLPDGFIDLNGAEVSRGGKYATLFSIYQTTYGAGDGSTTFNLPDFTDCYLCGGTSAGYIQPKLPNPNLTTVLAGGHNHTAGTLNATGGMSRLVINEDKSFSDSGVFAASTHYGTSDSAGWGFEGDGSCKSARLDFELAGHWTSAGRTGDSGGHTHTINVGNSIYTGAANEVKPKGIKLRVYTRYM